MMKEDHTGKYIAHKIAETIAEYKMIENIQKAIWDIVANMSAGIR